jgi:hypothetical protein
MPLSALPKDFNNTQTGDWANIWPFKYITPSWTAFGPRCTEWWAKWRPVPIMLLERSYPHQPARFETDEFGTYASAIQYWYKWSFQLQWPLFFAAHYYIDPVPAAPMRAGGTRVFFVRIGARRNADGFYDFPSAYVGLQWN